MYYVLIIIGVLVVAYLLMLIPRLLKNIKRKRETSNTYAIQNIKTGKDIRVHNAEIDDGRKIIQYKHQNWECMTWQFIRLEGDTYLLKNLYTHKTFQPVSEPEVGVTLWQQSMGGNNLQYWEFLKQPDDTYYIRLKDTELYISISGDESGSDIVLMPLVNATDQKWKLIEQHPIV